MSDQPPTQIIYAAPPGLLNYEQASAYLSLEKRTLERLVHDGAIPVMRIGRQVRFPLAGLEMWIEENSRYENRTVSETLLVRRRRREAAVSGQQAGRPREGLRVFPDAVDAEAYYSK